MHIAGTVQTNAINGSTEHVVYHPTVTIRTTDNATAQSAATTWAADAPPSITPPGDQTSSRDATVSLPTAGTCPNGPCSYALTGAPTGLTIDQRAVRSRARSRPTPKPSRP